LATKRILSLWFSRLAADRAQRLRGEAMPQPLVVVGDRNGAQILMSLSPEAEHAGLALGQSLRDATAICPTLQTVPHDPLAEARFLAVLRRWAGRFSPWVAEEPPAGLMIDLTGTAHLFGGEHGVLAQVASDCLGLGLTVRAAIADTPGAAWALARYTRIGITQLRSGDAIDQEARATRSRAAKRRGWERGGNPPHPATARGAEVMTVAPPGKLYDVLAELPIAGLRLPADVVERLSRLGLRRIGDISGLPRAALARRFGADTLKRLDQALGLEPEPISPARAPLHFALRLTLPDPIGLRSDVEAALDRLLPAFCDKLRADGRAVRRVLFQAFRADGGVASVEVGLARAADSPERIRPLLHLKLDQIDAGFGIDCLRIEALATETLSAVQHGGQIEVTTTAMAGKAMTGAMADTGASPALDDLIGRLGARLGSEAVIRLHPADSHVPAKSAQTLMAAWSAPYPGLWPTPPVPRPLVMFRPEPVDAPETPDLPSHFRWRRRAFVLRMAAGPERLQPEWWFDDPDWRGGTRDYWRVETMGGDRLWLFYGQGGAVTDRWYCEGVFS
jgi:protein ImuB